MMTGILPKPDLQNTRHFHIAFGRIKQKAKGFLLRLLERPMRELPNLNKQKPGLIKATTKDTAIVANFIEGKNDWQLFMQKENILAIHKQWSNDVGLLQKNLYLRKAGINVGSIKGNGLVPHHELALSTIINNNIPKTEISSAQALQYLRKKEIGIDTDYKGWVLCTFNNYPLGWAKILHNRVNNYYPTEWRILKD